MVRPKSGPGIAWEQCIGVTSGKTIWAEPAGASATRPAGGEPPTTARLAVIGGFLGAGKTTALAGLAELCRQQDLEPGLLTNDPGRELSDTASLRALGWRVAEIGGGSLGTRLDTVASTAARMAEQGAEFLIAEAAGTCAGLGADFLDPWREFHGDQFQAGPVSVLIDPRHAESFFGLSNQPARLAAELAYLYSQQLEDADLLVINKIDRFPADRLRRVQAKLKEQFPGRTVFEISARQPATCRGWFERILDWKQAPRAFAAPDRDRLAAGAARLSWLNNTIELSSRRYFDGTKLALRLASAIQGYLRDEAAEVVHCKLVLVPSEAIEGIGVVSLTGNDEVPEVWREPSEPISTGRLTLNLRAQANPEILNRAVNHALLELVETTPNLFARMQHSEHFRLA